ncbi:MAG: thioredoxin [Verrucomicrobiales bacterium]|nr:thioredoxin [Verrucomicrobiales bacterium]
MKHVLTFLGVLMAASAVSAATWLTDFTAAQAKAKAENKPMLVLFTGSDWCGYCIQLRRTALSSAEFNSYAEQNLVLMEVDFPRRKPLSPAQTKANEALAAKYGINGFPTLVLFNSSGSKHDVVPRSEDGKEFVSILQRYTGKAAAASVAQTQEKPKVDDGPPPPMFNGAPLKPLPQYTDLKLQGISGPAGRRLAIVNSQTLGVGEGAKIKLGNKEVSVRCVEIRQKSVLLAVDGQNQEVQGNW